MFIIKSRFESEVNKIIDKLFAEESFKVFKREDILIEFEHTYDLIKQNHIKVSNMLMLTHIPTDTMAKAEINTMDIEMGVLYTFTVLAGCIDAYNTRMENYKNGRDPSYIDLSVAFAYSSKMREFVEKGCEIENDE